MVHTPNRLRGARIQPIVVPLWLGCERRGPDLGAVAMANAIVADRVLSTRHEPVIAIDAPEPPGADQHVGRQDLRFLPEVAATCRATSDAVSGAVSGGALALVIGGDHAVVAGSIPGTIRGAGRTGVLWIDAHGDLNTPATSPSGHLHGMSLGTAVGNDPKEMAAAPGAALLPGDLVMLGVRDLDPGEADLIDQLGIRVIPMTAWRDMGIGEGIGQAIAHLGQAGIEAVHLSFDLDVLDPSIMPGTGVRVAGGLLEEEARLALRVVRESDLPVTTVDWVELNPLLDPDGRSLQLATSLLGELLGSPTS